MSDYLKIRAIAAKINLFGGTTIAFNGKFKFGGLHLYDIRPWGELVFVADWDNRFGNTGKYKFPLHWFSETFFAALLPHYLNACKENLTERAYNEVLAEIEE